MLNSEIYPLGHMLISISCGEGKVQALRLIAGAASSPTRRQSKVVGDEIEGGRHRHRRNPGGGAAARVRVTECRSARETAPETPHPRGPAAVLGSMLREPRVTLLAPLAAVLLAGTAQAQCGMPVLSALSADRLTRYPPPPRRAARTSAPAECAQRTGTRQPLRSSVHLAASPSAPLFPEPTVARVLQHVPSRPDLLCGRQPVHLPRPQGDHPPEQGAGRLHGRRGLLGR